MKLLLIRGLPGSGKRTMAKGLAGFKHYEADMFFMCQGEYKYDHAKIGHAHTWCQRQVAAALSDGNDVVVSNTFTRLWELQPYMDLASRYGATVFTITVKGEYVNTHGVPEEAIDRMRSRWED